MTAKANQVELKVDDVLARVDAAADRAVKSLDAGTQTLVEALDLAGNLGDNLAAVGNRLRARLAPNTNNPPPEE